MSHPRCCASTGIHEDLDADGSPEKPWGLTFGSGELDQHGYWEFPCQTCARAAEARHGVPPGSYWPFPPKPKGDRRGRHEQEPAGPDQG